MEHSFKLIGAPCAHRGPYTFYKAFKYTKNNITNILTINDFFFVKLWSDSDLISIGELRLLWEDKTYDRALASLRLYILPENTPDGRITDIHGEDEVLAITEKVVIKLEDLLTWITEAPDWSWGLGAMWREQRNFSNNSNTMRNSNIKSNSLVQADEKDDHFYNDKMNTLVDCSALDYSDVHKEKRQLDITNWETRTGVVVLSYSRYCRYRSLIKRLEGCSNEWLTNDFISALGGFTTSCRTTKILFCKDTFDYPDLEGHELLCNHLAPKLRSRIPKKKKVLYPSPDVSETDSSSDYITEDENDDERLLSSASSSASTNSRCSNVTSRSSAYVERKINSQRSLPVNVSSISVKNIHSVIPEDQRKQKAFIQNLYSFMKARLTPISRLPSIGNKEINLFEFYNKVKHLGGYSAVTNNKLWKYTFVALGGEQNNSTATIIAKKCYEKFLLPYEQHMAQQLKHTNNQFSIKSQSDDISKSNSLVNDKVCDSRIQVENRKEQQQQQITVQPLIKCCESKARINSFCDKPGDKENIPLSERKLSVISASAEVIDLCGPDEENSTKMGTQQKASSSVVTEIIDLCGESPIKRSVPSIAATLLPRKRKLDILKEGGLEVTPILTNVDTSSSRNVVTIIRKTSSDNLSECLADEEVSVEILNPKKYSTYGNGDVSKMPKTSHQILDLRTTKNGSSPSLGDNLIKKFSSNLGPNIEISLVPNEYEKREEKKRMPALRKISTTTGKFKVNDSITRVNSISDTNKYKPNVTIAATTGSRKMEIDTEIKNNIKPVLSINSAAAEIVNPSSIEIVEKDKISTETTYIPNVNQSLYLAALYNSIFPTSTTTNNFLGIQSPSDNVNIINSHQKQLSQQQLNYLNDTVLHQQSQQQQQQQIQELNNKSMSTSDNFAFAQKFSTLLKNNTVSIIQNYEKILPD